MIKLCLKTKRFVFTICFGLASLILVSSSFAQNFRKPNVHLEIKIGDKVVAEKDLVTIHLKEKLQLQVSKSGKDVTTDKKIQYFALTPWSLTVSPDGVVEGKYPSSTDKVPVNNSSNRGMISITYGHVGEKEIGSQFVNFFVDFSRPPPSNQPSLTNDDQHKAESSDIKKTNAISKSEPFVSSMMDTSKENVPADILESLSNREIQNENASSDSDNQQADFIDYDQLRKIQNDQKSQDTQQVIPVTKSNNPSLELTPEERQLYDEGLKQP